MEIFWYKCKGGIWCELNLLDTNHKYVKKVLGVYIIWYEMQQKVTVKIGFGKVGEELDNEISDLAIQAFAKYNPKVTWCELDKKELNPVAAFLSKKLHPKIPNGEIDTSTEFEVNLPWE